MPDKKDFDACKHKWKFHIDAASSGFPESKPWQAFYICEVCSHVINFSEKCLLDQTVAQNDSLKIQEKAAKTGMWANIIAAGTLVIAFFTLLFGDKIIQLWK